MRRTPCNEALLRAYLAGELDDQACAEVERHALACSTKAATKRLTIRRPYPALDPMMTAGGQGDTQLPGPSLPPQPAVTMPSIAHLHGSSDS